MRAAEIRSSSVCYWPVGHLATAMMAARTLLLTADHEAISEFGTSYASADVQHCHSMVS